jgi:hypothetical protein
MTSPESHSKGWSVTDSFLLPSSAASAGVWRMEILTGQITRADKARQDRPAEQPRWNEMARVRPHVTKEGRKRCLLSTYNEACTSLAWAQRTSLQGTPGSEARKPEESEQKEHWRAGQGGWLAGFESRGCPGCGLNVQWPGTFLFPRSHLLIQATESRTPHPLGPQQSPE